MINGKAFSTFGFEVSDIYVLFFPGSSLRKIYVSQAFLFIKAGFPQTRGMFRNNEMTISLQWSMETDSESFEQIFSRGDPIVCKSPVWIKVTVPNDKSHNLRNCNIWTGIHIHIAADISYIFQTCNITVSE